MSVFLAYIYMDAKFKFTYPLLFPFLAALIDFAIINVFYVWLV